MKPKYKPGDKVWLAEFDNGCEVVPREVVEILTVDVFDWGVSYIGRVEPKSAKDDGLREFDEDQIEGKQ